MVKLIRKKDNNSHLSSITFYITFYSHLKFFQSQLFLCKLPIFLLYLFHFILLQLTWESAHRSIGRISSGPSSTGPFHSLHAHHTCPYQPNRVIHNQVISWLRLLIEIELELWNTSSGRPHRFTNIWRYKYH